MESEEQVVAPCVVCGKRSPQAVLCAQKQNFGHSLSPCGPHCTANLCFDSNVCPPTVSFTPTTIVYSPAGVPGEPLPLRDLDAKTLGALVSSS